MQVALGDAFGELRPHANGFRAEVEIDFANPVIGKQNYVLDLNPESFRRDICRARTFGCMNDVARLWSAGFALGASFENSVVFDEERLLNTEGLRYADECARHKVLDVVGDLALAGLPLLGAYRSVARRPQAQSRRADGLDGRSQRLAGGGIGTGAASARPRRSRAAEWSAAWSPRPMARTCPDRRLLDLPTIHFVIPGCALLARDPDRTDRSGIGSRKTRARNDGICWPP